VGRRRRARQGARCCDQVRRALPRGHPSTTHAGYPRAISLTLPATLAACLALTAPPPRTASEEAALVIEARQCQGLSTAEVERLLAIELTTVAETGGIADPLTIELDCRGSVIEIAVRDPVTRKRLAREIPAPPPNAAGRERMVALAISQLFVASWLELLMPGDERPRPEPAVAPDAVDAARDLAEARVEQRSSGTGTLSLGVGARFHGLENDPLPVTRASLDGIAWLHPHWGLVASAAYEGGLARRSVGNVRVDAALFGAGAAFRWPADDRMVSLLAAVSLEAGYVRFAGEPRGGAVAGPPTDGMGGGVGLEVGPCVRAGLLRASLLGSVGFMLRRPEALVARSSSQVGDTTTYDFEDPVRLGGVWAGATLRLGLEIGDR
jgi:hypothetical protein